MHIFHSTHSTTHTTGPCQEHDFTLVLCRPQILRTMEHLSDEHDAKNVHEHAMIQMMSVRPTSMQKKNRIDAVAHEKTHLPNDRNAPTIGPCQEHDFILNYVAKLRSQTFQNISTSQNVPLPKYTSHTQTNLEPRDYIRLPQPVYKKTTYSKHARVARVRLSIRTREASEKTCYEMRLNPECSGATLLYCTVLPYSTIQQFECEMSSSGSALLQQSQQSG